MTARFLPEKNSRSTVDDFESELAAKDVELTQPNAKIAKLERKYQELDDDFLKRVEKGGANEFLLCKQANRNGNQGYEDGNHCQKLDLACIDEEERIKHMEESAQDLHRETDQAAPSSSNSRMRSIRKKDDVNGKPICPHLSPFPTSGCLLFFFAHFSTCHLMIFHFFFSL
ncbi:hypothetical protein B9Z55_023691 [Caenorhabditis nigoni]|uniref:Uncharacterized protein n=1 Tax=Caenorhabditis nigoni TaxID=1611254 RepID=A0A2G5SQR1_9PELO|nr:hypothetical protein B9Z55_023691 [Caenorhabditis nigoni]